MNILKHGETVILQILTSKFMWTVFSKHSWVGEIQNVSILVPIGVNKAICRKIIGVAEGMKADCESWKAFIVWLKERGLKGACLVIGDKCLGMLESIQRYSLPKVRSTF